MIADLTTLCTESEFVKNLIELEGYAREGRLQQEILCNPVITQEINKEIMAKQYSIKKKSIICGALEGILKEIGSRRMSPDEYADHIRQVIMFLLYN